MIFFYNFQASSTHSIANVFVSEFLWPAQTETPREPVRIRKNWSIPGHTQKRDAFYLTKIFTLTYLSTFFFVLKLILKHLSSTTKGRKRDEHEVSEMIKIEYKSERKKRDDTQRVARVEKFLRFYFSSFLRLWRGWVRGNKGREI